jgi:signal recognition particle subunit SRP54
MSAGCGQPVSKINGLVKRYNEARRMMRQMTRPGARMPRMFQ